MPDWESDECHNYRVGFPIRAIDPPDGVSPHHDFSSPGERRAVLVSDIANDARVSAYALNFVRFIRAQKLDTTIVDREPYLDLYQLARSLIGAEPLSIALYGALQLRCHPEPILLTIRSIIKYRVNEARNPNLVRSAYN